MSANSTDPIGDIGDLDDGTDGIDGAADPDGRRDPTADGIVHLQAAAREVVAAARSFLDAVEETIADRDRLASIVTSVTELLEGAGRAMSSMSERLADEAGASAGGGAADAPVARVRRIVLDE